MPGAGSTLPENDMTFTGDYLMKVGLDLFSPDRYKSKVVELSAE